MRLIFGLALIAGLALAGFAIHTAQNRFSQYQAALADTQSAIIPIEKVWVARRQLQYGDELRPSDVVEVDWPARAMPTGIFQDQAAIFPEGEGPRTVLRLIERNEPLLESKVTAPGREAGLAATLTPGMRAFTLSTDVNAGVAGFLRPGDRVDVYWTGGGAQGQVTRLIEANLPLIAIDQITDEQKKDPTIARNITIEATPYKVAKLAQAQASGRLQLALVGVRDESESETVEATLREVLGAQETVAPAAPKVCTTRQRRGAEVVLVPIPCPDETSLR